VSEAALHARRGPVAARRARSRRAKKKNPAALSYRGVLLNRLFDSGVTSGHRRRRHHHHLHRHADHDHHHRRRHLDAPELH